LHFTAVYSATAVEKLLAEEAIIIVAVTVMSLRWVPAMKIQLMASVECP
jgi:hypothetical protein